MQKACYLVLANTNFAMLQIVWTRLDRDFRQVQVQKFKMQVYLVLYLVVYPIVRFSRNSLFWQKSHSHHTWTGFLQSATFA